LAFARSQPLKIGVFHPGTQHSWQTALAFQETGQLGWFATSIFYDPTRLPYSATQALPRPLREPVDRRLRRRFTPEIDPRLVRRLGMGEYVETAAAALRWRRVTDHANRIGNYDFARKVGRQAEREPVDVLWGYDTSSLQAFRWAKSRGVACVLERTSIHPRVANEVAAAEYERHPEFFAEPWQPKPQSIIDEEDEEIALADLVIVGSNYCAESLIRHGCQPEKIRVISYGYNERAFPNTPPTHEQTGSRPLRFVFVGNVNALKGMAYLLGAFARIPRSSASLVLVGGVHLPPATFARYADRVTALGALPRAEVVDCYRSADCLVFPSLLEGSSVVLKEIYGAGLGAIHTRAAGEGISAGTNGAIIASSSVEDIVEKVEALLHHPDEAEQWCRESWARRENYTWSKYRANIRDAVSALKL
jgi:glycosyltransferase involved in cell wall biosynthesis